MMRTTLCLSVAIAGSATVLVAAEPDGKSFASAARVLQRECIACHGHELQMAGLRLDTRQSAMTVIEPGNSDDSLLVQADELVKGLPVAAGGRPDVVIVRVLASRHIGFPADPCFFRSHCPVLQRG